MRSLRLLASGITALLMAAVMQAPSGYADAQSAISFDNLDPINTSLVAYKNVNDFIDALPVATTRPQLFISDNAAKLDYSNYLNGSERISTLWSELAAPGKLNVVLFTEQDSDWVDQKQISLSGEWLMDNELQSARIKKFGCNIAGMYLPGNLYFCVKNSQVPKGTVEYLGEAHKFAHEYTHYMEMNVKNWMGFVKGQGIGTRNPCWVEEGFATFYGFAVGSYSSDVSGKLRREFTRNLTFNYDQRRGDPDGTLANLIIKGDANETKRLFKMLENTPWPCDETQNAYSLGSIAAEALVAVKGQTGMVNFYKTSAKTGDWRASFQTAFGISVDSFYEKLTPYLASQFNRNNFTYETVAPSPSATPTSSATPMPSPSAAMTSVATPSSTPTSPSASKLASKKITLTCIKGKVIKKVTAVSPKCPAGYKKK